MFLENGNIDRGKRNTALDLEGEKESLGFLSAVGGWVFLPRGFWERIFLSDRSRVGF